MNTPIEIQVEQLRNTLAKIDLALGHINESIVWLDEKNTIEWCNAAFQALVKGSRINLLNKKIDSLLPDIFNKIIQSCEDNMLVFHELIQDDTIIFIEISAKRFSLKNKNAIICVLRDITLIKKNEATISRLSQYDELTGLSNRQKCENDLKKMLQRSMENNSITIILLINIDNFRTINESYGQSAGNKALQEISQHIQQALPENSEIYRIAGDEFIILMPDQQDDLTAVLLAKKIRHLSHKNLLLQNKHVRITVSIGIATYPLSGNTKSQLIKSATIALNYAKSQGKNNIKFYSENLHERYELNAKLESDLSFAIDKNELFLTYQPQINFIEDTLIGLEVLLRWNHSTIGLINPEKFIPLSEKTGLIISIGEWVIETACKQYAQWRSKQLVSDTCTLSINVSPYQLTSDLFVKNMLTILKKYNIPAHIVELEITESSFTFNLWGAEKNIIALANKNVRIALDDFGTGYASFSQIKTLPISTLKIDKSFIQKMVTNKKDAAIVNSMIQLAKNLQLNIMPEGIETEKEAALLKSFNCFQGQGYYLSKPLIADNLEKFLLQYDTKD